MKTEDRDEFLKCYNVQILRKPCIQFRNDFLTQNDVCPFLECFTIAGSAMAVYRKLYLQQDSIGIVPRGGYRYADNQSLISISSLLYEEQNRGILIQHAG
ncbi:hypothetical protein B566_EDAN014208 [Ephemera danica]|nr:hypothetical protein B566_EDAN014208 [Ephemera danica]